MKITQKSKRALITRLINRFLSNGTSPTKSLASSLCAISSFIFATRVIIEQGEKCQLVSQELMKRQIEFMRGSRGIGSKRTDSRTEKNRIYEEEEENGKMLERFSDKLFLASVQ